MAAAATPPSLKLPMKARLQIRLLSLITDFVARPDFTVNRRLMNILDRKVSANSTPINGVSTHDVVVDSDRGLWFRLFVPKKSTKTTTTAEQDSITAEDDLLPVMVFFHGGGFAFLSAGSFVYDAVCRRLCRKLRAVIVSVNYRLAPEHKFPAQYDDAYTVMKFLDSNDLREQVTFWPENADLSRTFVAGDSAGGNIAHHVVVKAACEIGGLSKVRVIGTVLIQPFFGGEERLESEIKLEGAPIVSMSRTEWMWKAYLPDGVEPDHWAKNVCGPNAMDVSKVDLPKTVVVVGGFDPLKDWQVRYCEWMRRSGKEVKVLEYPNACHAFYVFPGVAESSVLIDEIKEFMRERLSRL